MRVAIVGSGVAGLVAARALQPRHEVTVFEADRRVGGHVHTWSVAAGGRTWALDSGFIVYNERTYPRFTRLLRELGVATRPSTMSFSVRHDAAGIEYNGSTMRQLFARPANVVRPAFLWMLREVLRFNRAAEREAREGLTLGELLDAGRYSRAFRDWYLVPMGSAIWSAPPARVLEMPARFFVAFFRNHGMLTVDDRPEWRVVDGGSARYIEPLIAPFRGRIRVGTPVRRVARAADHVTVDGERFDRVVLACHGDQALALLADPTRAEREVLGAFPYQRNDAVLHTDTSLLPRARRAWGAWNYRVAADPGAPAVVTYDLNILQSLRAPETFCVTLNGDHLIDPARIVGRVAYDHPVTTPAGVAARARRGEVSGVHRTHYCGAYWGNGFHEDGVASAHAVAREFEHAASGAPAAAVA
jgi:predicted NAD/FAD-binding protein